LINLVHRAEQKTFLEGLGAENVLVTSDENFESRLADLSARLGATIAFDAVGGALTGQLLRCMPDYSTVLVYGALSDEKCRDASQIDFIFKRVEVKGFYVVDWLARKNLISLLNLSSRLQGMMVAERIKTVIQRRVSIHESVDGLLQYSRNMTAGKILITF
jgi:NADPH:quinone reductase-like Zn-dependent oxidoreductase